MISKRRCFESHNFLFCIAIITFIKFTFSAMISEPIFLYIIFTAKITKSSPIVILRFFLLYLHLMPLVTCRFKSFAMTPHVTVCTQIIFTLWTMENITHIYYRWSSTFITSCSTAPTIWVFCAQFKFMVIFTFCCY